jgi:hypothetical protein
VEGRESHREKQNACGKVCCHQQRLKAGRYYKHAQDNLDRNGYGGNDSGPARLFHPSRRISCGGIDKSAGYDYHQPVGVLEKVSF